MYRKLTPLAVPLALLFGACGDDVEPIGDLLTETRDATEAECPTGGTVLATGQDDNDDGVLDADEIDQSETICNPEQGETGEPGSDGFDALIEVTVEPAGENCADGGQRFDAGLDQDRNGQLDDPEIESTTYICNAAPGEDGADYRVKTSTGTPAECEGVGALIIESGFDDNDNGELEPDEVDREEVICFGQDGFNFLIDVDPEAPGANCSAGGQRITRGFDRNRSGSLEPTEIDDVQFLCDPVATLVVTSTIGAGAECEAGGLRIDSGLDVNGDGELAEIEVNTSRFVCDGPDGRTSLVATSTLAPGGFCENGGLQVDTGFDDNDNGVLDADEITSTNFACDGDPGQDGRGNSAVRLTAEPAGANCENGGTRVETGPDTDGDGQLDDDEVTQTRFACDGGARSTLVDVTVEPIGENCVNGGQRIDEGVDDNEDGVLDADEIDSTSFVCSALNVVPIAITTASALPDAFRGSSFSVDVEAVGGIAGGYQWTVISGALPPGITLSPSGNPTALSGTATATGTFTFELAVTDFVGSVDSASFTLEVTAPPCEPGVDGMIGTTLTETTLGSVFGTGYAIAADESTTGWVYVVGTSELNRVTKDGVTSEDLEALPALAGLQLGYEIVFADQSIYVLDDSSSSLANRVQRISDDGGQTFSLTDMVSFTTAPTDMRGMAVDGDTLYMITQGSPTEIYSADISGTLPAPAVLEASVTAATNCSGLDLDDDYFYTGCTSPQDQAVRIDRTTFTVETLLSGIDASTTYNAPRIQDTDNDGVADILWFQGFTELYYICDPTGPGPYFNEEVGASELADYGLAIDRVNLQLFRYDDFPDELYTYQ